MRASIDEIMTLPRHGRRSPYAVLAIAVTLVLTLVPLAGTASAQVPSERIAGDHRYETAADIATEKFTEGATEVILATGTKYPDALAANYLASQRDQREGAPILLTLPDRVPQATRNALQALGAESITIMGGTDAISAGVAEDLAADYDVERIGGANRYETAAMVALAGTGVGEIGFADRTAIITTGRNFPDALAAGPISVAGEFPLLLTEPHQLPQVTADALAELDIDRVVVTGGTDAVDASVLDELENLGYTVQTVWGENRSATAAAVAEFAVDELGFSLQRVVVASGRKFPDALTGGVFAGLLHAAGEADSASPIVLTWLEAGSTASGTEELGDSTVEFLQSMCSFIDEVTVLGGPMAVSAAAQEAAAEAADC